MQDINEQAVKERRDLERVSKKLEKIAARQKQLGKNAANINEHYILIRSGDYYLFEGDPEEEEQDSGSDGDTKSGHQRAFDPDFEQRARKGSEKTDRWTGGGRGLSGELDSSGYKMQRQHLRDAWPSIEPNNLDVLGHYTDPYTSDRPTGKHRPESGRKDRRRKVSKGLERSGNLSSSSDDYISAPSQQLNSIKPGYKSHRRLASYPETYVCPPDSHKSTQEAIEMRALNRRGTRFRTRMAADAAQSSSRGSHSAAAGATAAVGASSFEPKQSGEAVDKSSSLGHRRIASAGSITPLSDPPARTSNLPVSSSAQPISTTNKSSANAPKTGEVPSPNTGVSRPSFTNMPCITAVDLIFQKTDRPLNEHRSASHRLRVGEFTDRSLSHRGPLERRLKSRPKLMKSESLEQSAYIEPCEGKLVAQDSGIELLPLQDRQTVAAGGASRQASVVEEIVIPTEDVHRTSRTTEKESFWSRFKASCLICHMFFLSTIDRTIRLLNGVTREHRRVRRTIDLEKRMVKRRVLAIVEKSPEDTQVDLESIVLEVISGNRSPYRSNALPNENNITSDLRRRHHSRYSVDERSVNNSSLLLLKQSDVFSMEEAREAEYQLREKAFRRSRSSFFLLFIAIGNLVVVHSELFCYVILVLNHMRSANVLSLVCPLMVFLWAMLSVPRPTKTFWITLITYTEVGLIAFLLLSACVVIIIKYIFQFRFIAFNDPKEVSSSLSKTHWLPGIFGIEKAPSYAIWDLIQLLFIFLHRSYLKNHGLWRDDTEFRQDLDRVVEANKASYTGGGASHHVGDETSRGSHSTYVNTQSSSRFNPVAKLRRFYSKMTDPRYNKKVDVYVYMFICEFLSFWIIIFGYQSFGPSVSGFKHFY
ncbi:unnamed protein product [Schistocephalus solidus]|uniref:HP domain-containing protein n=1 Tax=Schistocephalus solidus TaxID=70667 RepID=A0A183T904_SCHSO|nr:unnamed protein product [Schistocephalus solidus]